jgi:tRNA/rRNA methyltransferase
MGNFGLSQLRLVKPRDGWPSMQAQRSASGADRILDEVKLYDALKDAIADCNFVLAATARQHDQAKEVIGAEEAARRIVPRAASGENVAVVFGRERNGLENDEVGLADAILTLPVNPAFASLNLAQAVAVVSYECFKHATNNQLPFMMPNKSQQAPKEQLLAFFDTLERELEKVEFFRPPEKHRTMTVNLRNIITRMMPSQQDIQTLHGVIMAIADGRKGPARGGVLDGEEAKVLRVLIAERGTDWMAGQGARSVLSRNGGHTAGIPSAQGPVRGLAKLLRRNPTNAERMLWDGLTNDRRFASRGFKRQVPVGPHIPDFVSFPLRTVIDLTPADEPKEAARARNEKLAWLSHRNYRIISVPVTDVESDLDALLNRLDAEIAGT